MAQLFTDKYLKALAALKGGTISGDRECERCGYNRRGLRYGGRCPECGAPIRSRRHDASRAFHEMPLPLIRRFRRSCHITTVAMAGLFGGVLLAFLSPFVGFVTPGQLGGVLVLCLVLWVVGTWMLTQPIDAPQASAHGLGPRSQVRRLTRVLQTGWVVAIAGIFWPAAAGNVLAFLGWAAGMAGVFALAVHLTRFAEWVGDEYAAKAFQLTLWGTATAVPILLMMGAARFVIGGLTVIVAPFIVALALVLLAASMLAFPVGLFALSRSISWSAVHARERVDRNVALANRVATKVPMNPAAAAPPPRGDDPIPLDGGR